MSLKIDECDKQLKDIVDSFSISDEEYEILNKYIGGDGNGSRVWLGDNHNSEDTAISEVQIKIFSMPFEEMPLHINSLSNIYRIIAKWRLQIGR